MVALKRKHRPWVSFFGGTKYKCKTLSGATFGRKSLLFFLSVGPVVDLTILQDDESKIIIFTLLPAIDNIWRFKYI